MNPNFVLTALMSAAIASANQEFYNTEQWAALINEMPLEYSDDEPW